jgi:hypothetical protein
LNPDLVPKGHTNQNVNPTKLKKYDVKPNIATVPHKADGIHHQYQGMSLLARSAPHWASLDLSIQT